MGDLVVGFDASEPSRRAARWAAGEAASRGRPLLLVHVFARPLLELTRVRVPGEDGGDEPLQQAMRRELGAVVDQCTEIAPGLDVRTELLSGDPVEVLGELAQHAELLVVGSTGLGGAEMVVVGSTPAELLSRPLGAPVVVLRGVQPATPSHVVVGVDGSRASARAIDFAIDFAARHGCGLVAVHAASDSSSSRGTANREATELLSASLADCTRRYPGVPVRQVSSVERPARALVDAAQGADLLVVGSHGRGRLRRRLLGSVSHAVLQCAPCPVAVVRA
jgi:nucleotide-binding universal stress UspA family protein